MTNLTIAYNTATRYGGGIYCESSAAPAGSNLILWGNTGLGTSGQVYITLGSFEATYSCVQDGWAGIGNISEDPTFVGGPDGDFYLSQTAAGQPVQSPCVDAGDPASPLIDGTTRTDGVPDSAIVDMGYHYITAGQPPPVQTTLTPYNPPIQIPASGGTFDYNIAVTVNETTPQTFDVWIMVTLPTGAQVGPVLGPVNATLPGGATVNRDRTQGVPPNAPAGNYDYTAYVGSYPDDIWDEDSFAFEKLGAGYSPMQTEWKNWGEDFDDLTEEISGAPPSKFALLGAFPNPFNPATTISFSLPEAALVSLGIYDISGRMVSELVNGWRQAGTHEVTFDGSKLASGVYIYRLEMGQSEASGKMMLIK